MLTSATGAESSIAVTARFANSNHFSIDVLGVVGFDVGRTATAVGNIDWLGHFDRRNSVAEMSEGYGIWLRWVGGGRVLKVCEWQKLKTWNREGRSRALYSVMQPSLNLHQGCQECLAFRIRRQKPWMS